MSNKPKIAILYVFGSESTPGKTYQTLVYVDGSITCDCPGWRFKKKTDAAGGRTCRHVRDVDAGLAASHAVSVVEYAKPAVRLPAQRAPQSPAEAIPGSDQNTLNFAPKLRFDFEV